MVLVSAILQDYVVKELCDFIGKPIKGRYHVTLDNHVVKALYNFMVRSSSQYVTMLPSLVTLGHVVVEI